MNVSSVTDFYRVTPELLINWPAALQRIGATIDPDNRSTRKARTMTGLPCGRASMGEQWADIWSIMVDPESIVKRDLPPHMFSGPNMHVTYDKRHASFGDLVQKCLLANGAELVVSYNRE